MKRLLPILIITFALFSCDRGEEPNTPKGDDSEIVFSDMSTKVAIENAADMETFGVSAKMNTGDEDTPEANVYFTLLENERVYRDASDNWTYDRTRYWVYDRTFHFFAVHPHLEGVDVVRNVTFTEGANQYDGFEVNFKIPTYADTDLMIAHKTERPERGYPYPESVAFDFSHILSKINIKVSKDAGNAGNKVIVDQVIIDGIKDSGTYRTSREAGYTDNWTIAPDAASTVFFPTCNLVPLGVGDAASVVLESGLMVIPQPIEDGAIRLTIQYDYYNENGTFAYSKQVNAVLPNTVVAEWEAGKSYVYNVKLDAESNNIEFLQPEIPEGWKWGDGTQMGGSIVIQ